MRGLCSLFLLLLVGCVLSAQQPIPKDSITQLDEVILLDALKRKNTVGIIPSEVIGPKTFQNYSPVSMVSAINQTPGVYIFSGALNTNRITIRGIGARTLFGTNKLRLYYNDIPVTNGAGTSEIESFDLENLSQIEVVKGPKATSFGANLGGAIILNPKEALGRSTNFSNNVTIGSFGLLKNNLSFNHFDGKLRLGLQYGHTETEGYRENSNFERDGLLLNTSYQINSRNTISLLLNHIDYTAQIPSSLGATAFAENPQQATFTWRASQGFEANNSTLVGVSFSHEFTPALKNTTSIFYSYLDHYEARPFGILDEFTNGYGFRTRFSGNLKISDILAEYHIGAELYKDEYRWNEFENLYQENNGNGSLPGDLFARNKEFRDQLNTFTTVLLPFTDTFSIQLGLNWNKTDYDYRDLFNSGAENKSAIRNFKAIVLPSINMQYDFTESGQLYVNVSRGFSNPGLEETLTPDGVVNPDIAQETGINYEFGGRFNPLAKKFKIDFTLYQMNVRNLLVAERVDDDRFIGRNAGKTKHQGLELALSYLLDISPKIKLTPFLNYTLNDHKFISFVDGDNDFSGNPLTGVAKNRIHGGLQTDFFNDFYCNITYQHVGAIPLTDANNLSSDAFNLVHTRLGYRKKLSDKFVLGFDFGINNLFDIVYAQSVLINTQGFGGNEPRYYYPGDERNFYGSLRLGYRL
ncbi:TonB-dependent receptor [Aggregatimonas sangjinii]|uniref:TonB-dependent receptor n=1 Tax=Aggregatimonas sangjinii TaxID=2583587 RepID=A0A5B7SZB8_9FLAO|nr:TonB-dependent receptor [Aggregatimonas sangjinii]QCX02144.1 TonB-dependent receptor [Aggregatimonas sangjinii]